MNYDLRMWYRKASPMDFAEGDPTIINRKS